MTINQFPAKFGKYILLDRLNAGGMAEVFRAKVTGVEGFERLVAIKCMLPALLSDENFTSMFVDEARLATQVTHANVVQIYELGRQAGRLYIAMELIHGRDLRHLIRTVKQRISGPLPPGFVAYLISRAALGLDHAHHCKSSSGETLGIVHRDVSPQNLLVSYSGEVKVVDFGIAKASNEVRVTETQVGVLKGKFAYMAPEQVVGDPVDARADIFALGAVLYEGLVGERLFVGDNDLAVLERVRDAVLPNLEQHVPQDGHRALPVLKRALALNPSDRFASAAQMAEALDPLLIVDQRIFGSKQASELMLRLYGEEVDRLSLALKHYAEVNESSCVADIRDQVESTGRLVYESAFAEQVVEPLERPGALSTERSSSVVRQVALTRRPTEDKTAAASSSLDATGSRQETFAPLQMEADFTRTRVDTDPDVVPAHAVKRPMLRLRVVTAVLFVGLCGLAAYLSQKPKAAASLEELRKQVQSQRLGEKFKASLRNFSARTVLDGWLFGSDSLEQAPQAPAAVSGWVLIVVSGLVNAHVFVDDELIGTTPLAPLNLKTGTHVVRAEHKKASGKIERRQVSVVLTGHEIERHPKLVQLVF